jgi:hypothetical protein
MARLSASTKQFDEVFQFRPRGFVAGQHAEEGGEFGEQFLIFHDVAGDLPAGGTCLIRL